MPGRAVSVLPEPCAWSGGPLGLDRSSGGVWGQAWGEMLVALREAGGPKLRAEQNRKESSQVKSTLCSDRQKAGPCSCSQLLPPYLDHHQMLPECSALRNKI